MKDPPVFTYRDNRDIRFDTYVAKIEIVAGGNDKIHKTAEVMLESSLVSCEQSFCLCNSVRKLRKEKKRTSP